jgi:excisionase family DNA binding protein
VVVDGPRLHLGPPARLSPPLGGRRPTVCILAVAAVALIAHLGCPCFPLDRCVCSGKTGEPATAKVGSLGGSTTGTGNLEAAITAVLRQAVRDELRDELRALAAQVEQLRRCLPAQLVTMPEAAERLGVSVKTVTRMVKRGDLPHRRLGRSVRVDLAALHPMSDEEVARAAARARSR